MRIKRFNKEATLWSKGYILILISNIVVFFVHNMMLTGIPMYAQQSSFGNAIAGLTTTIYSMAALLFRPLFGIMIDTKGRRGVMLVGTSLTVITVVLYCFANSVTLLLLLRVLHGVAFSALSTVCATMVVDEVPQTYLSEGVGFAGIASILTAAVGPSLSIGLIHQAGFGALFITALLISLLSLALSFTLPYKPIAQKDALTDAGFSSRVFEKTAIRPSIVALFVAITMGSISAFIPAYGTSRNIEGVSWFFTSYALAAIAVRLFSGKLMKQTKSTVIFSMGALAMALGFVLLAVAESLPLVVAAALAYGVGNGLVMPVINVVLMQRCSAQRRGAANAMLYAALDIGMGFGAFIWGGLSDRAGYGWVYMLCAAVILMAMVLFCLLLNRHNLKRACNSYAE